METMRRSFDVSYRGNLIDGHVEKLIHENNINGVSISFKYIVRNMSIIKFSEKLYSIFEEKFPGKVRYVPIFSSYYNTLLMSIVQSKPEETIIISTVAADKGQTDDELYDDDGEPIMPSKNTRDVQYVQINVISTIQNVEDTHAFLKENFELAGKESFVDWRFITGGRTQSRRIPLTDTVPFVCIEFYPYLNETPQNFISKFLESSESVLLLSGPPGTGKTTFIRWMILQFNLKGIVTYDEELLDNDEMFIDFLTGNYDFLLIEDADLILKSRERDNNKMMSRFLNTSDGLIKLNNKKIIFTTNLSNFDDIDPALIRPGRCFGAYIFRNLTEHEAAEAATKIGVDNPHRSCSLAELFNAKQAPKKKEVGFIR